MKGSKTIKPALLRASIGFFAFIILLTGTPAQAATIKVKTATDEDSMNMTQGSCSLREAVNAINQGHDAFGCRNVVSAVGTLDPYGTRDTISIPTGTIKLTAQINPPPGTDPPPTAPTGITPLKDVTIQGAGYSRTIIDGQNSLDFVPFDVGNDLHRPVVSIQGLTIQNSQASGLRVNIGATVNFSFGRITKTGSTDATGGCINNNVGTLNVDSSDLQGCTGNPGGGIFNLTGTLQVTRTTIHDCVNTGEKGQGEGGGIFSDGGFTFISDSTLANNRAYRGAGFAQGDFASAILQGVTIVYNENTQPTADMESNPPAALFSSSMSTNDKLEIKASIVANNTAPNAMDSIWAHSTNCGIEIGSNQIVSDGHNLLGNANDVTPTTPPMMPPLNADPQAIATSCAAGNADFRNDPKFMPTAGNSVVANNAPAPDDAGRVGPVYVPKPESPGVSYVPNTDSFCLTQDERALGRSKDGNSNCDIGAVSRSSALFVFATSQAGVESAGDTAVAKTLNRLGFDVIMADVTQTIVTSNDATGKAIVVVSKSTVNANNPKIPKFDGTTFRDVSAGVLVMNRLIYGDMMMTGDRDGIDDGTTLGQTKVDMASSDTFGYLIGDRGTVTVTTGPQMFGWGVMPAASNPSVEGNIAGSSTRRAIFSYLAGSPMFMNFSAPGLRVGFFATQGASANPTPSGTRLLEEAIIRAALGPLAE